MKRLLSSLAANHHIGLKIGANGWPTEVIEQRARRFSG